MKKILILALLFVTFSCTNKGYVINGTINGDSDALKDTEVYLSALVGDNPKTDTAKLINGRFTFKGECEFPFYYAITIKGINDRCVFFLENEKFTINANGLDLRSADVKGGSTQNLIKELKSKEEILSQKYDIQTIYSKYSDPATTSAEKEELMASYEEFSAKVEKLSDSLTSLYPASFFSLTKLYEEHMDIKYEELISKLEVFASNDELQNHPVLVELTKVADNIGKLQNGRKAPDFTLISNKGKDLTFSEVYSDNKVTMIDFWAAWCGPCRRFNPVLKKIYSEYNKLGFEVLAVSLDEKDALWKEAIAKDGLPWLHVSDLKGWRSEVASLYNVRFIPQNIFVDANGLIIGRQLSEDKIKPLLDKYFK